MLTVDAGTLLNTTIPNALAGSPDQLAEFNKSLAEMQAEAGIDPKQVKLVAISMTMPKSAAEKPQFAGVLNGTFDTAKLNESLRKDSKTGAEIPAQQYEGQTLYVKTEGTDEFAASVLDSSTLVIGSPAAMVRQVIDARAGKGANATTNAELFSTFKATNPTSLLRFAMRFPQEQLPPNQQDPMSQSLSKVRFLSGALDASAGLNLDLTAKTASAADAKPLHDQLQQLITTGKTQLADNQQMASLAAVLDQTKLSMADTDVRMTMNIPPGTLAQLATDMQNLAGAFGGGPPRVMPPAPGTTAQ